MGIASPLLLFDLLNRHIDRIFTREAPYGLAVSRPAVVACKYHNDANLIGALYAHLSACGVKL